MITRIVFGIALLLAPSSQSLAQSTDVTREFLIGQRTTFSTKDHPKAKGVNFTISYPNSWAALEGIRPNIVQKFVSNSGKGLASAMILTKDLQLPPGTIVSEAELEDLFAPTELRGMVPSGAVFVDAKSTKIEGIPAGILEYTSRTERAGMEVEIHVWSLNFVTSDTLVQIFFQVGGLAGTEGDLSLRMAEFKPLFTLMANSIVLPEKWILTTDVSLNTASPPTNLQSLPFDDPPLLILTILVSFVITWSIGLAPPLLIRYAFMRRPLSKKAATWIALGFSVLFWFSFLLLNLALDQEPGRGVVWVVVFFVSRWIMSRGYASPPINSS